MPGFDPGDDNSRAPKRLEPEHRSGDSFDGSVVLPGDVVEVFVLTHQDIHASVSLDTFNSSRVGAALVDGDLLWHVVQVDGALQESSSRSQISLGSEKKVNRTATGLIATTASIPNADSMMKSPGRVPTINHSDYWSGSTINGVSSNTDAVVLETLAVTTITKREHQAIELIDHTHPHP